MAAPQHVYVTYIRTTPDRLWNALGDLVEGDGEISEREPFRRLVCRFDRALPDGDQERPSRVTFEIDPLGDVCRLTMVHDDFHGVTRVFAVMQHEWPRALSDLKSRLETGESLDVAADDVAAADAVEIDVDVEDHRDWGRRAHGRFWELVERDDRSDAEDRELLEATYASAWHWRHAGTAINEQRAEWMLSRAHAVLGNGAAAQRHADRCWAITESERIADFDFAYACEAMYRSAAVRGEDSSAREWFDRAEAAAKDIGENEDRQIFAADLARPIST
jgi:hypothetical protein